jgi:hypothetical protein
LGLGYVNTTVCAQPNHPAWPSARVASRIIAIGASALNHAVAVLVYSVWAIAISAPGLGGRLQFQRNAS